MENTHLYWYIARGSGIVAYLLLTVSVVLGIALSRRWYSASWPRLVVHETHRWATITFYLFLGIHVATLLLDAYIGFSLADVLVPFASDYRTPWLALGIIGAELALAIGASVWARDVIGYRAWHALHGLAYPIFAAALLHGLRTGTDTGTPWMTAIYAGSLVAVLAATIWRTARMPRLQVPLIVGALASLAVVVLRLT